MMDQVKPEKHSVAVVVRTGDGTFLAVRRPDDPEDPLAGLWGLPAVTLADEEDELSGVIRAGRAKLGVELAVGRKIGEKTADRGDYVLFLADYEAVIASGTPSVPQPDNSMTQYADFAFVDDPQLLTEAADAGSLCAQILLEHTAAAEQDRVAEFRRRNGLSHLIDVHTHFMPDRLLAAVWAYFDAAGPLVGRAWPVRYRAEEQRRLEVLRGFGVRAFTSMLYPHKPGMARSLNDWAAGFAERNPDCLHSATFFAESSAPADVRHALDQGARVFKCHLQVGGFNPNDPLLDDAWGQLAEAGIPVVTHCGSGPVATAHRPRADRRAARQAPGAAAGRRAPGHAGVHGVSRPGRALRRGAARHHDGVHPLCGGDLAVPARRAAPPEVASATACCWAPTSRTSRTPTPTPSRPSNRPAWAPAGSAPSATTTRRSCSASSRCRWRPGTRTGTSWWRRRYARP